MPIITVKDPTELGEEAWSLINEAVQTGKMTLADGETTYRLQATDFIRLIQWLATSKARKPHVIPLPEDFRPKETGGEDEASD